VSESVVYGLVGKLENSVWWTG